MNYTNMTFDQAQMPLTGYIDILLNRQVSSTCLAGKFRNELINFYRIPSFSIPVTDVRPVEQEDVR